MGGEVITVTVNGLPAPQGSKKSVGNGRMIEVSKALGPWREAVRTETQNVLSAGAAPIPRGVAVDLLVTFWLPRPKAHHGARGLRPSAPRFHTTRVDLDKLVRAAGDGLTAGGVWQDDSQVVVIHAEKRYAGGDQPPGMVAVIRPLGPVS